MTTEKKKFKIGWGTGIVIAFAFFITFIMYFVLNMSINKKYDHDFVTEDYYKKELAFQNMMEKAKKTASEQMGVGIQSSEAGVTLTFPQKTTDAIVGTVYFYRPSDQKRDFRIPLQIKDNQMLVPMNVLSKGRWVVEVNYQFDSQDYISTEKIDIK